MPPQRRESTMSLSVVLSMLALLLSVAALVVPLVTDQNDSTSCSCEFMTTSTDSDGVTTVEVPGDLVIRGGLVVSDDNSIERIRIDGGIGTERRRLTSGGTVSLRLNDENGNPRTEMDSDGNFRTRRADGTEVATVDATDGFKMKDSSSRVRFSTFEDGRTEISDEDGDVRTVSNKEGIELREKPTEGRRLAASGASSMPRGLTRLTAGTIEIRDENNKTRVKTDKEGQHVKNEQEEDVAVIDGDGVAVVARPGMTTKPAIRSIEEKPDGETVDRFRADNSGTEVRDENNMTRVKTDKDGAHVKDADGFDTAVIDGDGVTVMEKPGSTSRPAIRSVDETGVERFRADKDGTEIRDAQNGTRMRADQDGTSFFDSEGKSAVDITDGGILLNDRLATDGNTSESAIRMLSSNGTVRTKVDTGGYDLRNPDGYTSVKLSGAGAGNYTAALKIFDPVTGAPRFEAGADLGLRINDKNGTTRSRVHEGVNIYDANGTSSGQVAVALGSAGLLTYASDGDISLMMKRSGEIETLIAPQTVRRDELQTTAQAEIATHDAYDPEDELKEDGLYRRPGMKADTDEADVVLAGGAGDNKAPETYERADDGRTVPVVAAGMTAGGAKDCSTVDCQKPANHADACCRG